MMRSSSSGYDGFRIDWYTGKSELRCSSVL